MNNQQPYQYKYDRIGNLVQNTTDGIADIEWNIYGKVEKVTKTPDPFGIQATVEYRYDGTGNRIMKKITAGATSTTTTYLRDASGNVMAIYEEKTDQTLAIKEIPIYGSSRLGQYRPKTDTKKTALGQRIYEFSNHLGNVLVTLSDNKVPQTDGTYKSVVVSASDYYPFGMAMGERTYSNSEYRYGFNGKENDTDFGSHIQDYGFRLYSRESARFLSVDPLSPSYPWYTPYQFAGNIVIACIDLDGLEYHSVTGSEDLPKHLVMSVSDATSTPQYIQSQASNPNLKHVSKIQKELGIRFETGTSIEDIHTTLDLLGMIPVVGELADGTNAIIYLAQGDLANASLSAVALVPVLGSAGTATRLTIKGVDAATNAAKPALKNIDEVKGALKKLCFIEGTKIYAKEGDVPIEELKVDDLVWSKNDKTGEFALKRVVNTFVKEADVLVKILVDQDTIFTTLDHPFWIKDKWVEARELTLGDSLSLYDNSLSAITQISQIDTLVTVYNFEVEDFHTYFIGNTHIFTHNNGCSPDDDKYKALQKSMEEVELVKLETRDLQAQVSIYSKVVADAKKNLTKTKKEFERLQIVNPYNSEAERLKRLSELQNEMNNYTDVYTKAAEASQDITKIVKERQRLESPSIMDKIIKFFTN